MKATGIMVRASRQGQARGGGRRSAARLPWLGGLAGAGMLLVMAGCSPPPDDAFNGYVESEPVHVASPVAGRLTHLHVARGDQVQAGAPLFDLERDREDAQVQESQARLSQARSQASDLSKGSRVDELAARRAAVTQAQAQLRQSTSDWQRQSELAQSGFVSAATLVDLQARRDADRARVAQLQAELRVAEQGARVDSQRAAEAGARAADAELAQSRWQLDQTHITAPVTARVEDTLYREGEWVGAGSPVVRLLAPTAVKVRFFVAQGDLNRVRVGTRVGVHCDACGGPIPATVRYVATQAEFTPPVIYSRDQREHLVYMVEAWPDLAVAQTLHPGLPVEVHLAERS